MAMLYLMCVSVNVFRKEKKFNHFQILFIYLEKDNLMNLLMRLKNDLYYCIRYIQSAFFQPPIKLGVFYFIR